MKVKTDITGNIPKIGDVVVYNPAYYKGIELLLITEFSKAGCPIGLFLDGDDYKQTVKTSFYITNLKAGDIYGK